MSAPIKTWQERAKLLMLTVDIGIDNRSAIKSRCMAEEIAEWRAFGESLAAAPAPSVAQGWQWVPIDPTEEMMSCGDVHMDGVAQLGDAWASMLAAAPPSPQQADIPQAPAYAAASPAGKAHIDAKIADLDGVAAVAIDQRKEGYV